MFHSEVPDGRDATFKQDRACSTVKCLMGGMPQDRACSTVKCVMEGKPPLGQASVFHSEVPDGRDATFKQDRACSTVKCLMGGMPPLSKTEHVPQ